VDSASAQLAVPGSAQGRSVGLVVGVLSLATFISWLIATGQVRLQNVEPRT
jgi:hypothetical protein